MGNRTAALAPQLSLRLRSTLRPVFLVLVVACALSACSLSPGAASGGATARVAAIQPTASSPATAPIRLAPAAAPTGSAAWPPTTPATAEPATPQTPPALVPAIGSASPAAPFAATSQRVSQDLFRSGDFVTQYTDVACVGASIQMMLNIVRGQGVAPSTAGVAGANRGLAGATTGVSASPDRSPVAQARLLALARTLSPAAVKRRTGGASAFGWAYALSVNGGGPYRVRVYGSLAAAVQAVAAAIARTGRPAGLLVWQGIHAWVASGYRAIGDPAQDPGARVTGLIVADPLWPRPTNSRGRTIPPDTFLATSVLARHFVRYDRPWGFTKGLNGSFVVVLPVDAPEVRPVRAL